MGIRLGIEGEKSSKDALRDINQSFKVLGSKMQPVTPSEITKNGYKLRHGKGLPLRGFLVFLKTSSLNSAHLDMSLINGNPDISRKSALPKGKTQKFSEREGSLTGA